MEHAAAIRDPYTGGAGNDGIEGGAGSAVLDLGDGRSVTFQGLHAADLGQGDFVLI